MIKDKEYYLNHIDEFYELIHKDKLYPFQKELLKAMAKMDNGIYVIRARQNGRQWAIDTYNELKTVLDSTLFFENRSRVIPINDSNTVRGKIRGYYFDERHDY